jgi:hypothetical protein
MAKDRYEERMLALNNEEVDLANQLSKIQQTSAYSSTATIGQTKKAFLTALYAERDFISGDDVKKRELAEISTIGRCCQPAESSINSVQSTVPKNVYSTEKP